MKYINFKNRGFVIFEETQSHEEMAKLIGDEVVSGGFAHATEWTDDGKIVCSGGSTSLKCSVGPADTGRIRLRFSRC